MRIIRHYNECPGNLKHSVIALGNFDGVHKGHQAVINTACDIAKTKNMPSAVMTFEPHPASVLRPGGMPFRIEGLREKALHIQHLGIKALFVEHFSKAFSEIPAEEFVAKILIKHLEVNHVVIGRDFIFGHNRTGNAELLHRLADHYGVGFTQVKPILVGGESCSSSNIRAALKQGEMQKTAAMLGRLYAIEGKVRQGDARGRTIGIPTANIKLKKDQLYPVYGVYAAYVWLEGRCYEAVVNIGKRPTFESTQELLEAHILDFNADIYGKRIKVELVGYIRPEVKFDGINSLKNQIQADIEKAKQILQDIKEPIC